MRCLSKSMVILLSSAVFLPAVAYGQSTKATIKVPMCLQYSDQDRTKLYVPCTGVVPVDTVNGNVISWTDILAAADATVGIPSSKAKAVQNPDGTKLATDVRTTEISNRVAAVNATLENLSVKSLGVVSSVPPVYTNGTFAGLSLTPSGALRVEVGSSSTGGNQSSTGLALDTSVNSLLKAGQTVGATQSGTWATSLLPGTNTIGAVNINGAVPVFQSAAWLTGLTGTLPNFASTPTFNIGTAPTFTTNTQGAVTTAAPIYTNNSNAALSLTTNGSLRVDNSTNVQPVSGNVTANIGSTNGLALDATVGTLFKAGQNIGNSSFGISGTLPAFAATPTVNLGTVPTVTVNNLGTVSTTAPVYTSGNNSALSLTTAGALRIDGSGSTQPVSGVVTANLGTLNGAATSAKQDSLLTAIGNPFQAGGTIANTSFGSTQNGLWSVSGLGAVTTAAPSYTNGTTAALSLTPSGALRVDTGTTSQTVTGTVTANVGTTNGLALDTSVNTLFKSGQNIGNTGFAINGTLPAFASVPTVNVGTFPTLTSNTQAAVTTASPTYTTGTNAALSLTTSGALRVDTGGSTQSVSGTITANLGTLNGAATAAGVAAVNTTLGTPFQTGGSIGNTSFGATQSGTWNIGAVSSITNPVAVTGTFYQATQPVSVASLPLPVGAATSSKQDSLLTALGSPLQAGGSIGNTSFGISGTLPAFASTPTFNIGTAPTLIVNTQTAVTTAAPIYTTGSNAALSLTTAGALRTDSSGTTQPVSGTVVANIGTTNGLSLDTTTNTLFKAGQSIGNTSFASTQSGTWNVGLSTGSNTIGSIANTQFGISGTLPAFASTPTVNLGTLNGAATAAKQDSLLTALGTPFQTGGSIGNTSFAISGSLPAYASTPTFNLGTAPALTTNTQGAVTTTAPTYTNNSNAALSLTTAGALRVDNSASTQPVSGTVTANIGTTNGLSLDATTNALFKAGQSIGNTTFASTQSGTWNVGLNTGSNTIGNVNVNGTVPISAASLPLPAGAATASGVATVNTTLGTPFQAGGSIGNTGFAINGTLPNFASTPTVNIGTAPTIAVNNLAVVNTSAPTYTNGSNSALSLTTAGALRVDASGSTQPVSGTITANVGTTNGLSLDTTTNSLFKSGQSIGNTGFAINGTLPAFASTPTVNIGNQAFVTTATPSYTNATNAALSLTTVGALRTDGSNVVQPISAASLPLPSGAATESNLTSAVTQLTNVVTKLNTLITNTGTPLQTGGSVGISGTLPAFGSTPTFDITIKGTAVDRGGIFGTTAATIAASNTSRRGFSIQVQGTVGSCYINGSSTATLDYHSLQVSAGGYYQSPDAHVGTGAISIVCTNASTSVYFREW